MNGVLKNLLVPIFEEEFTLPGSDASDTDTKPADIEPVHNKPYRGSRTGLKKPRYRKVIKVETPSVDFSDEESRKLFLTCAQESTLYSPTEQDFAISGLKPKEEPLSPDTDYVIDASDHIVKSE